MRFHGHPSPFQELVALGDQNPARLVSQPGGSPPEID